jgi:hypothetical protein
LKIHFNIIIPSTPGSFKLFFPSGFPIISLYTLQYYETNNKSFDSN